MKQEKIRSMNRYANKEKFKIILPLKFKVTEKEVFHKELVGKQYISFTNKYYSSFYRDNTKFYAPITIKIPLVQKLREGMSYMDLSLIDFENLNNYTYKNIQY